MTRRGWALFLAMCLVWGIPYLLIKVAVRDISPASVVFLRTAIGALVLMPIAIGRGRLRELLPLWPAIIGFTLAETAIPWLLLSDAELQLSSSLSGLLIAAVPLVGAVIAAIIGQERLDLRRLAGLLVGLAGVAALLGLDLGGGNLRAVGEVGIVVLGYAIGPMIVARKLSGVRQLDVIAVSLAICALGYAPFGISQLPARLPGPDVVASIVVLGLICTATAFVLYFSLIGEIGPVRATVFTYVNPAVAVLLGVTVLGEPLRSAMALGFVLILAGSYFATRKPGSAENVLSDTAAPGAGG